MSVELTRDQPAPVFSGNAVEEALAIPAGLDDCRVTGVKHRRGDVDEGNPTSEHRFHERRLRPSSEARKTAFGGVVDETVDNRTGLARQRQHL